MYPITYVENEMKIYLNQKFANRIERVMIPPDVMAVGMPSYQNCFTDGKIRQMDDMIFITDYTYIICSHDEDGAFNQEYLVIMSDYHMVDNVEKALKTLIDTDQKDEYVLRTEIDYQLGVLQEAIINKDTNTIKETKCRLSELHQKLMALEIL